MNTPAPVCPDTFRLIKEQAETLPDGEIARRLGWDVPMLRRVVHNFQLGVSLAEGAPWTSVPPPKPEEPTPRPPIVRRDEQYEDRDPEPITDIAWGDGIVYRAGNFVRIPETLQSDFIRLYRSHRVDPFAFVDIANGAGNPSWTSHKIGVLRKLLAPLGIAIEPSRGHKRGHGYRLRDLVPVRKEEVVA